jgi:hypothetical protein
MEFRSYAEPNKCRRYISDQGPGYIHCHQIRGQKKGLIHLLSDCRTRFMGSHYEQCDQCSYNSMAFNSCRNRHCPMCQQKDKLQWLEKRMEELLPVGYFKVLPKSECPIRRWITKRFVPCSSKCVAKQ